ncbi:fructose 1,6-bisphosphate 1-phosphatase NDAI_0J02100 [Naumovozyma dairenensis CBS 421]|uniref:Fructose-1,6-bisphosphatase n=1 Tax=Naumovozyma dairenensis (strain ATCC 10597 / BCRC 20456 / CBS 421 / NBRC 0211 / NRRL Y-12639) TaxID=1071378 RepID=G0WH24_NAUDC|nr:hypothetical protein NDAI_0J02100 [Naumovozyma dairenensis CBS 421]CCD27102.1 hypothetical protein NDAI_0J02100 [Naumovozyma dairenensis CBS 421]
MPTVSPLQHNTFAIDSDNESTKSQLNNLKKKISSSKESERFKSQLNESSPAGRRNSSSSESIDTDIITLSRFIIENQRNFQNAKGNLTLLLNALQFAFKFISQTIRKAELVNLINVQNHSISINSTGDVQKKLDILSDEIFLNAMKSCGVVKILVSEEQEDLIIFNTVEGEDETSYAVCCDPIDGSSNLDAGVAVGTIVSIFKILPETKAKYADPNELTKNVLRTGHDMVAACYAMYGASTHLFITFGDGVDGFTLDNNLGEFILTQPNLKIPEQRSIYSINEGNGYNWDESILEFLKFLKDPKSEMNKSTKSPYTARYIGSMVADVHRTFLYGGIFSYPCDKKNPNGKLRLLYEAFPMAFLMEQAGGKAVNDFGERILDLKPTHIHDKSSIWLGSTDDIDKYLKFIHDK